MAGEPMPAMYFPNINLRNVVQEYIEGADIRRKSLKKGLGLGKIYVSSVEEEEVSVIASKRG